MTLACSVVVPSFNRADRLDALLAALAAQDAEQPFEVVVVLDGSTDASRAVVSAWEERHVFAGFQWVEQSRKGQATARNVGAFLARAPVILFLDDDVIPDPDVLSIHLAHHAAGDRIAVLGDCEIVRTERSSFCQLDWWGWWEDTYHRRAAAWQPVSYRDFLTGHVSLRREDFAQVGGFDQDFTGYGGEDYELGYRLLRAGVRFVPDRRAHARHFSPMTVRKMLRLARQSGLGDVLMARKHPELISGLPFMHAGRGSRRRAAGLAMYLPWLGTTFTLATRALLRASEFLGLRRRWRWRYGGACWHMYWRGLRDVTGSMKELRRIKSLASPPLRQEIDLSKDLGPQVKGLNIDVPSTVILAVEGSPVGQIELDSQITQPLLEWIVQSVITGLHAEVVVELARAAGHRHPDELDPIPILEAL